METRQGQILRAGYLDVVTVALDEHGGEAHEFYRAGVVRDQPASLQRLAQCPAQQAQPKHLWCKCMPEADPRYGAQHPAPRVRRFHRVAHGHREQSPDWMIGQCVQQQVQVTAAQAGPGGVMDQDPVVITGARSQGVQRIQYRMTALGSTGGPNDGRVVGQGGMGPMDVRRVQGHHEGADTRMIQKGSQGVVDDRAAAEVQVLLGDGGAYPAAGACSCVSYS